MRIALVVNPKSGTAPEPARLVAWLRADEAQVDVVAIQDLAGAGGGGLDAGELAAAVRALSGGGLPDRVVVAGGDGSIGLVALLAAELGVPLAVIAAGTANDFARAFELPDDIERACALARDPDAATRHAELALTADGRPFVNAAATGLSVVAALAARAHKQRLGVLAYVVGALKAAATAQPLRCSVRADGTIVFDERAWQVVVGATGAFGGGSEIGGTRAGDGLLDVAVVPAGSRLGLARRAWGMRRGALTRQADVAHHRGASIEVRSEGQATFNIDGEVCRCEPARFTLRPGGFRVVVG